jgi:hypothetical protein
MNVLAQRLSVSNVWDMRGRLGRHQRKRFASSRSNRVYFSSRLTSIVVQPRVSGAAFCLVVEASAHSRPALWTTAAKGRPGIWLGTHWKCTGTTLTRMSGRGNAQQLDDFYTPAFRTAGGIASAADQGLEAMIARLALIFIKGHGQTNPSLRNLPRSVSLGDEARPLAHLLSPRVFWKACSGLSMPGYSGQLEPR